MEEEAVIAFKFLRAGGVAPFTGFRWTPGAWVMGPAGGGPGSGVHACRIAHLPYWADEELWRIELDGAIAERRTQLEAARARLVDRVAAWDPRAFADACAERAKAYAAREKTPELDEYVRMASRGMAGNSAFIAAVAAVAARGGDPAAFAEERGWQARWMAEALALREG